MPSESLVHHQGVFLIFCLSKLILLFLRWNSFSKKLQNHCILKSKFCHSTLVPSCALHSSVQKSSPKSLQFPIIPIPTYNYDQDYTGQTNNDKKSFPHINYFCIQLKRRPILLRDLGRFDPISSLITTKNLAYNCLKNHTQINEKKAS